MEGCVSRLEQQSSKSLKKGKEQLADVQRIHSSLAGVAKILSAAL